MANKSRKIIYIDTIYALLLITLVCYFSVLPLMEQSIRHIFVFLGSIICYFFAMQRIVKSKVTATYIIHLLILFCIMLFSIMLQAKTIEYEMIYSALNFLSLYVLITTKNTYSYSRAVYKWTFLAMIVIAVILLFLSQSQVAYTFEDGRSNGFLALGMTNSNLAGMMISGIINIALINFNNLKRTKFLVLCLIIGLLRLLILTGARSALLSTIFVIVYAWWFSNNKLPNMIVVFPIIFSIAFVPLYLRAYQKIGLDFVILNKPFFSGRQDTFMIAMNNFNSPVKLLFGDFTRVLFANAHNAPLTIACSIGVIGMALAYWNFGKHLIKMNNTADSFEKRMAIVCFMSVYFQSSMEALMLTGVFPSIAMMYIYSIYTENHQEGK